MRGFGTEGRPLRIQRSRWLSDAARSSTSTSSGPASGSGTSSYRSTSGPPSWWIRTAFTSQSDHDSCRAAAAGGGARARRGRRCPGVGLRPDRAAHPGPACPRALRRHALHDGAAGDLVSSREASARRPHGRLRGVLLLDGGAAARPGRRVLRERLDALGRRLGGSYRVFVDANQHVDREGAARSGVGFYGKNTMLITRKHGSWVVLGTLITDVEIEPTPPLELDCGSCTLCIEACPTGALDEPGTVDSTRCLSYWTQAPDSIPASYRAELGAQVYGCDICQDVCPWNRGIEKRRAGRQPTDAAEPHVSLVDWLSRDGSDLLRAYDRLYLPRNDERYLRRNAIVALGNTGRREQRELLEPYLESEDELLREHAEWAASRLEGRP
ncbi:MAG: tRNA epoxyqueuosine(34) reductase QueG [Actinobacteria bacterium]|nr:MAG: tRNA epoxyqueuosine(34) reductase QueG [Actinomycetota bacterium]